jgi:hypothetical protein
MSGATLVYKHRKLILYIKNKSNTDSENDYMRKNIINLNERDKFKNMIDIMERKLITEKTQNITKKEELFTLKD